MKLNSLTTQVKSMYVSVMDVLVEYFQCGILSISRLSNYLGRLNLCKHFRVYLGIGFLDIHENMLIYAKGRVDLIAVVYHNQDC